jgi:hypothetical protein
LVVTIILFSLKMDYDSRVNIRPIIPSLPASFGHSSKISLEIDGEFRPFPPGGTDILQLSPPKVVFLIKWQINSVNWEAESVQAAASPALSLSPELMLMNGRQSTAIGSIIKKTILFAVISLRRQHE